MSIVNLAPNYWVSELSGSLRGQTPIGWVTPLLATGVGGRVRARLFREEETLHAPHLLDLEIVHVLRRCCLTGELRPSRAAQALTDLSGLRMVRYPHEPYVPRIWALRRSLTAYDAAYVALAEALASPLITRDRRMASAHGHRAKIELVD